MRKAVLNSFQVKEGHCPHSLGAQSISKYCTSKGYKVDLISNSLDVEQSVAGILSLSPVICGFSSNYKTESYVIKIAQRLKQERGDDIVIVVGGPSVTYSSQESKIRQCEADLFVKGDGEEPFYQILQCDAKAIIEGRVTIQGVSSKQAQNETIASSNLNTIISPFPVDFSTDHIYWETSRGCAFNCIYCAHSGKKNQFRHIPLERIHQDIDYLSRQNYRAIYITDPILGGRKDRSKIIIKMLEKIKGSFITAEYRPEYLDEEIMDLLEKAKIGWLEFGLQTINPELRYFRRNAPSSMEKLAKLSRRGIKYSLDLIAGIPGDTRESFEESLKFAIEIARPTSLKVFPLRIYEETKLHQMAETIDSWQYNKQTRIIKKSHTFDEADLLKWMQLGKTSTLLYKYLVENNWFDKEEVYRNLRFFIHCSDNWGDELPEIYNETEIAKIWTRIRNAE